MSSKTTSMIQEELVRMRSEPTRMTEHEVEKEDEGKSASLRIQPPSTAQSLRERSINVVRVRAAAFAGYKSALYSTLYCTVLYCTVI